MYRTYEYEDYTFDDEASYNSFIIANDPENCTGWGGPNPENYGGYKKDEPNRRTSYEEEPEYYDKYYKAPQYTKDKTFYHGPFEEFIIIHETEKAYLLDDAGKHFWCPKSLVIEPSRILNTIKCRLWKNLRRTYLNTNIPF